MDFLSILSSLSNLPIPKAPEASPRILESSNNPCCGLFKEHSKINVFGYLESLIVRNIEFSDAIHETFDNL